jgi:hypothetical protein
VQKITIIKGKCLKKTNGKMTKRQTLCMNCYPVHELLFRAVLSGICLRRSISLPDEKELMSAVDKLLDFWRSSKKKIRREKETTLKVHIFPKFVLLF